MGVELQNLRFLRSQLMTVVLLVVDLHHPLVLVLVVKVMMTIRLQMLHHLRCNTTPIPPETVDEMGLEELKKLLIQVRV